MCSARTIVVDVTAVILMMLVLGVDHWLPHGHDLNKKTLNRGTTASHKFGCACLNAPLRGSKLPAVDSPVAAQGNYSLAAAVHRAPSRNFEEQAGNLRHIDILRIKKSV